MFQAPAPAPANDPFGDPFAVGDSGGGFDDNLLTPDKIEVPSEEPEQPPPGKKDAFGDLVAIGPKDKQTKSPKQMFVELATPPKKSLNELKVEKSPSLNLCPQQDFRQVGLQMEPTKKTLLHP